MREILKQRNEELFKAYLKKAHDLGPAYQECTLKLILKDINNTPCSRFFIEYDRARVVLENMKRGVNPYKNKLRRQMCEDMYARYKEIKILYPHMQEKHLVERTITGKAPQFYLDVPTINNIIYPKSK